MIQQGQGPYFAACARGGHGDGLSAEDPPPHDEEPAYNKRDIRRGRLLVFGGDPVFAFSLDMVSWIFAQTVQLPAGSLQHSRVDSSVLVTSFKPAVQSPQHPTDPFSS